MDQQLHTITPCFPVADIAGTMRWYEEHFAFESDPFPSTEPFVFCILRHNDVEIMLQCIEGYQKPDLYDRRSGGVWDAYIRTNGLRQLFDAVKDRVEIVQQLRRQPYGALEFEVKDPNGYVLVFSEAA
ncbi:MAG TPA: hypothetical protein VJ023_03775 [Pyrinomonadaceae bacterium]|nr:hypothetical protein [Pyrinomonadaceae bacterium]